MNKIKDTYLTINQVFEGEVFKDKGSKFFSFAKPVTNEEEAKQFIQQVKKKHFKARHWCYAWQIGQEVFTYRVNDDGEPSNSAGQPIYGQIQSFGVTNVLVVVVRYFGGVKLGVGGLINAYRNAAKNALETAIINEKLICKKMQLVFEYGYLDKILKYIKQKGLTIDSQELEMNCKYVLLIRKSDFLDVKLTFEKMRIAKITEIKD